MRRGSILCLFLLAVVPVMAQEQTPPPEAILHDVLSLTDAQMSTLGQLEQARAAAVQPILPQIGQAQQALASALSGDAPDPTNVGKALLAVRAVQGQVEQAQHTFGDGFNAMLSDAQRAQVQHIRAVETALRAAQALHAIGL